MPHPDPERRTNAPPGSERLLAGLTLGQAQAVTHCTGPLLLIAGPRGGSRPAPLPTGSPICSTQSERARNRSWP
jgi:hypothetical protein